MHFVPAYRRKMHEEMQSVGQSDDTQDFEFDAVEPISYLVSTGCTATTNVYLERLVLQLSHFDRYHLR